MAMDSSLVDSPSEVAAAQSNSESAASAASATSTTTCSLGKEAANNNEKNSNINEDEAMIMDTSTIPDDGHLSTTRMETEEANDYNNSEADVVNTSSDNLLHEHHHSNTNSSGNNNNNSIHHPMIIQQCKSIEEASVNTTVESVIMMNASDLDDVVENDINNNNNNSSNVKMSDANKQSSSSSPSSSLSKRSVSLQLTPEEERLFTLLINAAEAYEQNKLDIDPNPTESSVSARGGFTSSASSGGAAAAVANNKNGDNDNNKSDSKMAEKEEEQEKEEVASWLKPPPKVDHIEIRVAGGWVRDKLLNQHSVDVDVALDCMMGVQFARIVQSYLLLLDKEEEERQQQQQQNDDEDDDKLMMVDDEEQSDDINSNSKKPPSKRGHENPNKKKKSRQPKIGVIGANPSQSKHLETATMNVYGIDVDFVNLRAEEVYEANSRIPTSKTRMFGTPLEDALRRDFTINSLFYNVRSGKVEDWTGRGLTDLLDNRLIVTPVDPHETFHDDPLRVLRAIRFCVRLDFSLHDDIRQAAMSKRVHHSLHVKVSRERVGKELEGMMTGKHARPGRALDMIAELHLAGSVFAFPGSFPGDFGHVSGPVTGRILDVDYHGCCGKDGPDAVALAATHRAKGWDESSALLAPLPKIMESHVDERERYLLQKQLKDGESSSNGGESSSNGSSASVMDARLLHICVFILPFHNLTFPDAKGRKNYVATHMIKEALKWSTKDIQAVSKILGHVDEMAGILSELRSQSQSFQQQQQQSHEGGDGNDASQLSAPCRLRSGLLLRSLKEHWVTCLLAAAAWEIRSYQRLREEENGASTSTAEEQPSRDLYRAIVGELDLDECWRVRPHLNGKEIIKELSLPKGPVVGMYIEDQTKWMLLNPNGTREECMSHLVERKREREQDIVKEVEEEEENAIVDEQNESYVGVANGEGQTSPDSKDGSTTKHFSKKIRSDTAEEADDSTN